jgi:hypothetical protein
LFRDLSHLLPGQPGLRKRIADLALHDRPLDGIVSIGGCEIADQRRGRAADFDDTPLEQLDTRGALGHGRNIG